MILQVVFNSFVGAWAKLPNGFGIGISNNFFSNNYYEPL
jgi:hypothetical protein